MEEEVNWWSSLFATTRRVWAVADCAMAGLARATEISLNSPVEKAVFWVRAAVKPWPRSDWRIAWMARTVESSIGLTLNTPQISLVNDFCNVRNVSCFSFIVILLGEPQS